MARIRTIKNDFFTDDKIGELSKGARLLFIGLLTIADREGRLEDRPKRIKVQAMPYDDDDTDSLLQELGEAKFILRYEANSEKYIQIVNFVKHQRPHPKEPESVIPPSETGKNNGKKRKETTEPLKETANCVGRRVGKESKEGDGMHGPCIPNTATASPLPSQEKSSRLCDSEYLDSLQASEAYADLNVRVVHGKMVQWCKQKNKVPTRNRLLSWLNREDRPMTADNGFAPLNNQPTGYR